MEVARSSRTANKWQALVGNRTLHFGAAGAEDYTMQGDKERKTRYLSRRAANEDWTKSGVHTANFWSRWLFRKESSPRASAFDIKRRFGFRVKFAHMQIRNGPALKQLQN